MHIEVTLKMIKGKDFKTVKYTIHSFGVRMIQSPL